MIEILGVCMKESVDDSAVCLLRCYHQCYVSASAASSVWVSSIPEQKTNSLLLGCRNSKLQSHFPIDYSVRIDSFGKKLCEAVCVAFLCSIKESFGV